MKLIAILIISILTLSANGQIKELDGKVDFKSNKLEKVDVNSPLKVIYLVKDKPDRQPAYFIDGKHISETVIRTINPQLIDSISVVKKEITIEDKKYYGQLYLKMKDNYKPKIISLTDLKTKYTEQSNTPSIFMIDDEIVKSDYCNFFVDENYILKMEIQNIVDEKEHLNVNIIRLITKTKENIEKANEIRIRGVDTAMLNQKSGINILPIALRVQWCVLSLLLS
jgi:hypothetical protein